MTNSKHVKTLNNANLKCSAAKGGCGECQTSCQSACKTSCTVANQKCEHEDKENRVPAFRGRTMCTSHRCARSFCMDGPLRKARYHDPQIQP